MKTTLITTIWGDKYGVRADWSQASDTVETLVGAGEWTTTPLQVANFKHRAKEALRSHLEDVAAVSGEIDDATNAVIEKAVENAK